MGKRVKSHIFPEPQSVCFPEGPPFCLGPEGRVFIGRAACHEVRRAAELLIARLAERPTPVLAAWLALTAFVRS